MLILFSPYLSTVTSWRLMTLQLLRAAIIISCLQGIHGTKMYQIPEYQWDEVVRQDGVQKIHLSGIPASQLTGMPVYVTLTSMDSRISEVNITLMQILQGPVIPDHIYLFISSENYILDNGIPKDRLPQSLLDMTSFYPFTIVYTKNIGPHRKLLPLLAKKWHEDCLIMTIDDERKMGLETYLQQLIQYYVVGKQSSIVALKVRRIGVCLGTSPKVHRYGTWGDISFGVRELLTLPSGTGTVLYRPSFFHPIVFSEQFRQLTSKTDDLTFRLSTLVNRIPVIVGCRNRYKNDNGVVKCTHHCPNKVEVTTNIPWNMTTADFNPYRQVPPLSDHTSLSPLLPYHPLDSKNRKKKQRRSKSKSKSGSSSMNHRRLKEKNSLFDIFNKYEGNDKSWDAGVAYLERKGLLNISQLVSLYINLERGSTCTNATAKRSRSCMTYRCNSKA